LNTALGGLGGEVVFIRTLTYHNLKAMSSLFRVTMARDFVSDAATGVVWEGVSRVFLALENNNW
jgi:hypothetical protein